MSNLRLHIHEHTATVILDRAINVVCHDTPVADADPLRIEQILSNLLTNSDRHSPPGAAIDVILEQWGDQVSIAVRDRGPGIADDVAARVFTPYYQAMDRAGVAGLGLGLHVVRQLTELHGGIARVETPPGGGALFRILLPAAKEAP